MKTTYRTIKEANLINLDRRIHRLLADGWKLYGEASIIRNEWHQVLTRETTKDETRLQPA